MEYRKRHKIQASHFNGSVVYDAYKDAIANKQAYPEEAMHRMVTEVLPNIHGHNFELIVTIDTYPDLPAGWDYIIDDKKITEILELYNNVNLSVLDVFLVNDWRATTERLAYIITKDILNFLNEEGADGTMYAVITEVIETDCISAVYREGIKT